MQVLSKALELILSCDFIFTINTDVEEALFSPLGVINLCSFIGLRFI